MKKFWIFWLSILFGLTLTGCDNQNQVLVQSETEVANNTESVSCSIDENSDWFSCSETTNSETNSDFTSLEENATNIATKLWWLTPEDALEYMKNTDNLVIIDTRDLEVKPNGFVWWIEIPWNQMETRYTEIPKWASVLLHCGWWWVAPKAYQALLDINPNLESLGYIAWTPLFDEYNNWVAD